MSRVNPSLRPSAPRSRLLRKLTVASLAFAGTLGGIELLLRATGRAHSPRRFEFEGAVGGMQKHGDQFVEHEERFYTLGAPFRYSPEHAGIYALDRWGFRGQPAEPLPPAMPLVAVVGDSCVFGVGVAAADMLPTRLQGALRRRLGLSASRVLVSGFGVPGYSTVQIRALLEEEVLRRFDPIAIVLVLAAWNDHAPAMGWNDVELRERRRAERDSFAGLLRSTATFGFLADLATREPHSTPRIDREEIQRSWRRNEASFGRRVPEDRLREEVSAILDLARGSGDRPVVVVLPAHRSDTRARYPGLARDRERVRREAERRGLLVVDAERLFAESGAEEHALLCDSVHPTGQGNEIIAHAALEALRPALTGRSWPDRSGALELEIVSGGSGSALGDFLLRVELEAASVLAPGELPALCVGGAVVSGTKRLAPGRYEGRVARNTPGVHDLIFASRSGVIHVFDAVSLVAPRLEYEARASGELELRLHARPGDRAKLFFAPWLAKSPMHEFPGSEGWLPREHRLELPWEILVGESGSGAVVIPSKLVATLSASAWIQALIAPSGTHPAGTGILWSEPLEVRGAATGR